VAGASHDVRRRNAGLERHEVVAERLARLLLEEPTALAFERDERDEPPPRPRAPAVDVQRITAAITKAISRELLARPPG
jgi:hypothetical protein